MSQGENPMTFRKMHFIQSSFHKFFACELVLQGFFPLMGLQPFHGFCQTFGSLQDQFHQYTGFLFLLDKGFTKVMILEHLEREPYSSHNRRKSFWIVLISKLVLEIWCMSCVLSCFPALTQRQGQKGERCFLQLPHFSLLNWRTVWELGSSLLQGIPIYRERLMAWASQARNY